MVVRFIASSRSGSKTRAKKKRENSSKSHIVHHADYDGFEIEVVRKEVGLTVRRDVYDATIRRSKTGQLQAVSNYASIASAVEAAKKLVDGQRRKEMSRWNFQQRAKKL